MNPFGIENRGAAPQPTAREIKTVVREAIAESAAVDAATFESQLPPEVLDIAEQGEHFSESIKLSKLVDDDFPFDESQLEAINGMVNEQYACMTGAAGTGKTTSTKKLVDLLLETVSLSAINMDTYWRSDSKSDDPDDQYESDKKFVPSIVMGAFTGRATQQIKSNFPQDWHGNIMTIHRMLGFYPERYEDYDDERGEYVWKMRFVPSYTAEFKMPWDVFILDEGGMIGVDLWHQFLAAVKDGARIYIVGDINQLPPVHGKSVFGFAMAKWPSWELTHVHRQQGKNNPIVDNAWRVLNGRLPENGGRFQMIEIKDDAQTASRRVRAMLPVLRDKGIYDPIRDTVITPINGEEGSRGFALGQLPLNRELALIFNSDSEHPRYIIDGGREHKQFAVGDKVMATKNDWEAGITNGMTGVIVSIAENAGYAGDRRRFGRVEDVNAYLAEDESHDDGVEFSLEDLEGSMEAIDEGMRKSKEKRERGPASHIVTVRFGHDDHAIEIPFQSLSEVGSLATAYVVTCHKMQGGESPCVIIILHDAHKAMLYREWLYTAITRASQKCILIYTIGALKTAINKQSIKGKTLQEKVRAFNAIMDPNGLMGGKLPVILPESQSTGNRVLDRQAVAVVTEARLTTDEERAGGLMDLLRKQKAKEEPQPAPTREVHHHHYHTTVVVESAPAPVPPPPPTPEPIDIVGQPVPEKPVRTIHPSVLKAMGQIDALRPKIALLAPPKPSHTPEQLYEIHNYVQQQFFSDLLMLTHQPAPEPAPVKANPLAGLFGKGK